MSGRAAARLAPLAAALLLQVTAAQTEIQIFQGPAPQSQFGWSVDTLGDVDGDGCADILAGARFHDFLTSGGGYAGVYSGRTGQVIWSVLGPGPDDQTGDAVAACGDVDGDGRTDAAIGSPGEGTVRVHSGLDGTLLLEITEPPCGGVLDGAGDVDGDGVPDLVVGNPFHSEGMAISTGAVRVHSGADGSVLLEILGDGPLDHFGWAVAGPGDVDEDGTPDILAGVYRPADLPGHARVHSGRDGSVLHTFTGQATGNGFGQSVDGAGDVDGDGAPDLVVGAYLSDVAGIDAGRVVVYSGRTGAVLLDLVGDEPYGHLGRAVSGAGDVDLDGHADVLAGSSDWSSPGFILNGRATLYSGADGAVLTDLFGKSSFVYFGTSVSAAGDVNADGRPDILVGRPGKGPGRVSAETWRCGALHVYGNGCPGAGGVAPELEIAGCASAGGQITLLVRDAPPPLSGMLFVGPGPAALPMQGGCTLLVQPPLLALTFVSVEGYGGKVLLTGMLPMGLPPGTQLAMQAFVADPGAPTGFSHSNGARLETF